MLNNKKGQLYFCRLNITLNIYIMRIASYLILIIMLNCTIADLQDMERNCF